jgi:uncharacterized membrane protein
VKARAVFLVAAATCAAVWLWSAPRLPERVPVHFSGGGSPDSWSSRAAALWTFGLLGVGTGLLFVGLVWFVGRVPAQQINVPRPDYWKQPEHLGRMRRLLAEDMLWLGAWTLLLLAVVQVLVVRAAGMAEPRLGPEGFAAIGIYLLVVVARTAWALTRRYAVPTDGSDAVSPPLRPPPGPPR